MVEIDGDEIALTPEGRIMPLPGAIEALSRLKDSRVFVISNQAAVAVGSLPAMQAYDYIRQINELCGGAVTDFRFAMHPANADHPWRKPVPGMVEDLAVVYGLDLLRCVMIGDSVNDERCARAAGIGTFIWIDDFLNDAVGGTV